LPPEGARIEALGQDEMRAVSENFPFLANQMEYCNTKMPFLKHYENHGNHKRI